MRASLKLLEKDIARTIGGYLELDGWRLLFCEPMSRRDLGKGFGEPGMADLLAIRYLPSVEVLWIEMKKPGGIVSAKQRAWHDRERARGAVTLVLSQDCEASIDGFLHWYRASGLNRGKV